LTFIQQALIGGKIRAKRLMMFTRCGRKAFYNLK
jgi:hypothetical protein